MKSISITNGDDNIIQLCSTNIILLIFISTICYFLWVILLLLSTILLKCKQNKSIFIERIQEGLSSVNGHQGSVSEKALEKVLC